LRILSTGDWHIGSTCDEDVVSAAQELIGYAKEIKPDRIVITGDIYDSSSNPDGREKAKLLIMSAANISPVRIIKGNHDVRNDLLILGDLKSNFGIQVYEYPGIEIIPEESLVIHYLSWATKAGWIATSGITGIQDGNESVSLLALTYLRSRTIEHPNYRHIIFGHLMVKGALMENHQPLLGDGITVGYHDLIEAGFSSGAFGHIHKAQSFGLGDGAPEFRYNGSIAAMDYGESAKNKGFSVLDTDSMRFAIYQLQSVPRVNINALWNGSLIWSTLDGLPTEAGARVKVKLMIDEGFLSRAAEEAVKSSHLIVKPLELKIEKQSRPKDAVRAAEISAAKSASDKLVAYWTATNTTPEEPLRSDMLRITQEIETECLTGDVI